MFECYTQLMLVSISIRDFVLIDRLDLEPVRGFTSLTGETGAGKSIVLDALGLALGAAAEKRQVRAGATQASVMAELAPPFGHSVWATLGEEGIVADPGETLTLKRIVRRDGPSRALVNDQPVSAALLARIGSSLVEIHGQHAAAALWRPAAHRAMLDDYAGNHDLLARCAATWRHLQEARSVRVRMAEAAGASQAQREALALEIERLEELAVQPGEAGRLAGQRDRLMQAERAGDGVRLANDALEGADVSGGLAMAARELERVGRLSGFDGEDQPLGQLARDAAEALERALIEVREAEQAIGQLAAGCEADPEGLEAAEARLFAIRAEARRQGVEPDELADVLAAVLARQAQLGDVEADIAAAIAAEKTAAAAWRGAIEELTRSRKAAAGRLASAIEREFSPLRLGRTALRFAISQLPDEDAGGHGQDHVEIEVETNPGAGFGPLRRIASGGELARVSLALKCALAETGKTSVLVFDEADQGVGGSVAAAIGERLARLAAERQVFAVTHSPQVAAAADAQWLISKSEGSAQEVGRTRVSGLNRKDRCEEIARMLAGHEVTREARAAARRLLEERCRTPDLSVS